MNQEKIMQLLRNEDFLNKLADMNSAEEAQVLFEENGVELALQDVEAIGKFIDKIISGEISQDTLEKMANGELSEDELEQVTGGFFMLIGIAVAVVGTVGVVTAAVKRRWRW